MDFDTQLREIVATVVTEPMKSGVSAERLVEIRDEALAAIKQLIRECQPGKLSTATSKDSKEYLLHELMARVYNDGVDAWAERMGL